MVTCTTCGVKFDGFGYTCSTCKVGETVKDQNEKNRRQNESIARENAAAAHQEARFQRRQMEQLAQHQQMVAQQQQEMAEEQIFIENQKLSELQKQTRLIEEQAVSVEDAFDEGYQIGEIRSSYLFDGEKNNYFDNPYITSKLNKSFAKGVEERLSGAVISDVDFLNLIFSKIESSITDKRKLLIRQEHNASNEELFSNVHISLNVVGLDFDFGYVVVDLRIEVNENTGEVVYLKPNLDFTGNSLINQKIIEYFDLYGVLKILNEKNKKLERLEVRVSGGLNGIQKLIDLQKKSNNKLLIKNSIAIIFYIAFLSSFALSIRSFDDYYAGMTASTLFLFFLFFSSHLKIKSGFELVRKNEIQKELKEFLNQIKLEHHRSVGAIDSIFSNDGLRKLKNILEEQKSICSNQGFGPVVSSGGYSNNPYAVNHIEK
jgi:hypothetical protein